MYYGYLLNDGPISCVIVMVMNIEQYTVRAIRFFLSLENASEKQCVLKATENKSKTQKHSPTINCKSKSNVWPRCVCIILFVCVCVYISSRVYGTACCNMRKKNHSKSLCCCLFERKAKRNETNERKKNRE